MKKKFKYNLQKTIYIITSIILPTMLILSPFLLSDIKNIIIVFFSSNSISDYLIFDKYIIELFISTLILLFIRKNLKEKEFCPSNIYGNFPKFIYFYASKVLNYGKINLVLKPYYIQFYICLKNLFQTIEYNKEDIPLDEKVSVIKKEKVSDKKDLSKVNLIISDTYEITDEQIPDSVRKYNTIYIEKKKNSNIGPRVYSPKLINITKNTIDKLDINNIEINLFLTTNTRNTYEIINNVIKNGGRKNITINLYNQNGDFERKFNKFKKINIT